jgi:hypothetical protein
MNLASLTQLLTTLVQVADNNTALALSDTSETVSHDRFNRIIQTQRLTSVLTTLVLRLALTGGYLILDDTILEKFTAKLGCVFKLSANSPQATQARRCCFGVRTGAVL